MNLRRLLSSQSLVTQTFVALILIFLAFMVWQVSTGSSAFRSSEVAFTDNSTSGLSIVPASCPSSPHALGCEPGMCPSGEGYTYLSGGLVACVSCTNINQYGECVPEPPLQDSPCPDDAPDNGGGICQCPTGQVWNGSQCVIDCPSPRSVIGGVCRCPSGYTYAPSTNQCVFDACPAGQARNPVDGQCHVLCGDGITFAPSDNINQCSNQCMPTFSCVGNGVKNSCTSAVAACPVNFTCSAGSCIAPASPSIVVWNVRPTLVQSGTPVLVTWEAQNVSSCTVRGTNGDGSGSNATGLWNTSSGDKTTSSILGQTIYTILCQALAGATPASVTRSTTVNIVPVFKEQ